MDLNVVSIPSGQFAKSQKLFGARENEDVKKSFDHDKAFKIAFMPVLDELGVLSTQLESFIPVSHDVTHEILQKSNLQTGKKVRPALFFLACKLTGYKGEQLIPMGAVAELVHVASLIHDDVVDDSSLRRNKPTLHLRWGKQSAVLMGDLIYARASEMMAQTGCLGIVETFARTIRQMSESELIQLENSFNSELPTEVYFSILLGKTASLMGSACRSAGFLQKLSPAKIEALGQFGINLGMAFQLLDDALDYLGDEEKIGKKVFGDLFEGKMTHPLLLVREKARPEEKQFLKSFFGQENSIQISKSQVNEILRLVNKYEGAEGTLLKAREFTNKALAALTAEFSESVERAYLENLANALLLRTL